MKKYLKLLWIIPLIVAIITICKIGQMIWWNYRVLILNEPKFSFVIPFISKNITNDTLFTIAIGRNILENGITNIDTLTFHENLEFKHSGVFDILINTIYNVGGFRGIYIYTVFMAFVILLSLVIVYYKNTKDLKISIIFGIGIFYLSRRVFVARAQEISFLLFILEFYFIEKLVKEGKKRYSFILIFIGILLANFHSSVYPIYFVMYLPYIANCVVKNILAKNSKLELIQIKDIKLFVITLGISLFTGFCSTAGTAPYTDMFKAMKGISTEFIGELSISTWSNNMALYVGILVIAIIIALSKEKIKITDLFYILGFGAMAIFTFRCTYFFWLIAGISINRILLNFINTTQIINQKPIKESILITFAFIYVLLGINSFILLQRNAYNDYIEEDLYPVYASDYILENIDYENMRIFNNFNYGSYLEFKGIKAFIDSRSGMFTEEFNPGCTVLEDWLEINEDSSNYEKIFNKYKITHVITQNSEMLNQRLEKDEKYNKIYTDEYFSLYEKIGG